MHHWLFRASPGRSSTAEDYLTAELVEALSQQQREVLWLGRDFALSDKWEGERQRERGQVRWGVL